MEVVVRWGGQDRLAWRIKPCPRAEASWGLSPRGERQEGGAATVYEEQDVRESVLFIGTRFSILYTFMYSPA